MVQESSSAASLRAAVAKAHTTVSSPSLIEVATLGSLETLQTAQRQFLLDSFAANKLNKQYKQWEAAERDSFVNNEVLAYNKRVAQMARLNDEVEALDREYDGLRNSISLPDFRFSIQTIQEYENGRFLQNVPQSADGKVPLQVRLNELFSLDSGLETPTPTFAEFSKLVNLEYRLRMQRQIKYEVLLVVKQQLTAKNKKWAARDSSLNQFMTRDLPSMFDEVAKIKQSEYEDLRHYNDDDDDDETDQENGYQDEMAEHEETGPENDEGPENEEMAQEAAENGDLEQNGQKEGGENDGMDEDGPATENIAVADHNVSDQGGITPGPETPLLEATEGVEGDIANDELMDAAEAPMAEDASMAEDPPIAEEDHDEIMNIDG